MKVVKILAALVAALSILNSSGASPGATEKVAALITALLMCQSGLHKAKFGNAKVGWGRGNWWPRPFYW